MQNVWPRSPLAELAGRSEDRTRERAPYHRRAPSTDLDDAWNNLHDAQPPGWFVGQPAYDEWRMVWEQHAFDPSERAKAGVRSREWTSVAATELEVIRGLMRYLRVIREGRVPE